MKCSDGAYNVDASKFGKQGFFNLALLIKICGPNLLVVFNPHDAAFTTSVYFV